MANKWMTKLLKQQGAVAEYRNVHADVLRSGSPSLDFIFGNGHGLPFGYTSLDYGPPKSGKSLIAKARVGQLHRDDPSAMAIYYNTEMRESAQMSPALIKGYGIDMDRYQAYEVNAPDLIFEAIAGPIAAMCEEGAPIRLIIIDSLNDIQGRRAMGQEGMMTQNRGDKAATLQDGLQLILPIIRRFNIALVLTAQQRAEQDENVKKKTGSSVRPGVSFGALHFAEYFLYIEPNFSKDGRTDMLGNVMEDKNRTDIMDNKERTGHKIRVKMMDSSLGPKKRSGEFTLDYHRGIVNQHEEVFQLGLNWDIIEKPTNLTYAFGDKKWTGQAACVAGLRDDPETCQAILRELKRRDLQGYFAEVDRERANADAQPAPDITLD